jgi:hypothetical protein
LCGAEIKKGEEKTRKEKRERKREGIGKGRNIKGGGIKPNSQVIFTNTLISQ